MTVGEELRADLPPRAAWYALCRTRKLGRRPIARSLFDQPLVLFRDSAGRAATLLDRCAHRNVPLSLGRLRDGGIECAYHGWQFGPDGRCQVVPCLLGDADRSLRQVPSFATREQQGVVWVFGQPGEAGPEKPPRFPFLEDPRYGSVRFARTVEASFHATLENMLDVPHTGFLHRGLFRGGDRVEIESVVRRWRDRVEVEYIGERRPTGLVARLLAPGSDAAVEHFDRFRLPCTSEVEYRIGETSHLFVCAMLTPVAHDRTRFEAVVSFRLPLPHSLVRLVVSPIGRWIFAQDAALLRRQTGSIRRFGGESFASTELDLIGPQASKLLRQGFPGPMAPDSGPPVWERSIRMEV